MNWDNLEKFSKRMEVWHNRIYRWVCIGIFVLVTDIIAVGILGWSNYRSNGIVPVDMEEMLWMYDFIIYVGSPIIYIFLAYTLIFTGFRFPIGFKGDGSGRKIKPPKSIL